MVSSLTMPGKKLMAPLSPEKLIQPNRERVATLAEKLRARRELEQLAASKESVSDGSTEAGDTE